MLKLIMTRLVNSNIKATNDRVVVPSKANCVSPIIGGFLFGGYMEAILDKKICAFPECGKRIKPRTNNQKYCCEHKYRIELNEKYGLFKYSTEKYPNMKYQNPNYKGGISVYKNQTLLKKARKQKMIMTPYCEDCGEVANLTHHKDKTKYNHDINNLKSLCCKCHRKYHPTINYKFKNIYGMSLKKICNKLNLSSNMVKAMHNKNELSIHIPRINPNEYQNKFKAKSFYFKIFENLKIDEIISINKDNKTQQTRIHYYAKCFSDKNETNFKISTYNNGDKFKIWRVE